MSSTNDFINAIQDMAVAVSKRLYITGLSDTPSGYQGHSGDYLVVNDGETGIHFTGIEKIAADLTDYGFGGGSSTIPSYTDLPDVTENDGKIVASGCDLYHSCNGTWNKIGGESIPAPDEAPGCVTNLEEYNQYQEYKDVFLADNLGNTFDQMLNSNNDISNLIFDVCLFPESSLEEEKNTVIIDETTYKWGMFASPQTINVSAQGYSDGQGNDCVFSEWTSSNANFGDSSSANTTVFVDTDLSITGSFECLVAPSQPSCDQVVLHVQPAAGETITDKSSNEHAITVVGDTVVDDTTILFAGGTMNFDGNEDYLRIQPGEYLNFDKDGDFTIECWFNLREYGYGGNTALLGTSPVSNWYFDSVYNNSYTTTNPRYNRLGIETSESGIVFMAARMSRNADDGGDIHIQSNDNIQLNTWYHVAAVYHKDQHTFKLYLNGQLVGQDSWSINRQLQIHDHYFDIGGRKNWSGHPGQAWNSSPDRISLNTFGSIQDVRISKKAVYASDFVPPTNLLNNPPC